MPGRCVQTRVFCFMTPSDLREIADKMEERWSQSRLGDDLIVKEWDVDATTSVVFSIDQDRIRAQRGPSGQGR